MKPLIGTIGSGLMGRGPFDRRSWSTSSFYFFTELKRRGILHRAFGVEAPRWRRYALMARNFRPDRESWKMSFYNDIAYRDSLTVEVARALRPDDFHCDFLQVGAMYDVPRLVQGRASCVSYHDGNLAQLLRSPYAPKGLGAKSVDRALAYERSVYQGMSTVFAMSEYLRQSFVHDFGVPESRVVAVGAGINLDEMPGPIEGKRYDTREILFIGADFARKGGWALLKAFREVRRKVPGAVLHVVGPVGLRLPPSLESGVVVHGFLGKNDPAGRATLDGLFRRCCLYVLPSLYEPFGISPLEALAHQIPCLVTDGWALRELVRPGQTGDLVACDDVGDLRDKLASLLADPDALARMGAAGRAHVSENYTWERVVDRMLKALDRGATLETAGPRCRSGQYLSQ